MLLFYFKKVNQHYIYIYIYFIEIRQINSCLNIKTVKKAI